LGQPALNGAPVGVGAWTAGLPRTLSAFHGRVLEIARRHRREPAVLRPAVDTLAVTGPVPPVLRRLPRKSDGSRAHDRVRATAEDLPFEDASFDVAVSPAVLCSVDGPPRSPRELAVDVAAARGSPPRMT